MNVLVLNCGSSSAKFAVINATSGKELISGIAQRLGSAHASLDWKIDGQPVPHEELLSFCLLMFMAGLDTVSIQLAYSFHHLATHPADRARLVVIRDVAECFAVDHHGGSVIAGPQTNDRQEREAAVVGGPAAADAQLLGDPVEEHRPQLPRRARAALLHGRVGALLHGDAEAREARGADRPPE